MLKQNIIQIDTVYREDEKKLYFNFSDYKFDIEESFLSEDNLVAKILTKKEKLKYENGFLFITQDNIQIYESNLDRFLHEYNFSGQGKHGGEIKSWFGIKKLNFYNYGIFLPCRLDNFVFFFKTITQSKITPDLIVYFFLNVMKHI
jgi:hypothetical protein